MKNEYKKYNAAMILCFLIGGFSIFLYIFQLYSAFWGFEIFGAQRLPGNNLTELNRTIRAAENRSFGRIGNPITDLTSPFSFMLLLNGIVLILGGIAIWKLTREKEIGLVKEKLTSLLLLPEERIVIDELKKSKGEITQSQLVKRTGMSKVKIHRVVNRLAAKGIIKKYQYGLTNKIVLEKDL